MENPFEAIYSKLVTLERLINEIKVSMGRQSTPKDNLLTVKEAATFLNLSIPTIYSKVSKGELPYMKRSKRLYFMESELIGYIKKGRRKTSDVIREEVDTYFKKR